jgi:hypothetical protein
MHKRLQTRLCDYGDASESLSSAREKAGVHETSALRVFNRLQRIDLYKKSVKKHLSPSRRRVAHRLFVKTETLYELTLRPRRLVAS